jgi:hypothetical protein
MKKILLIAPVVLGLTLFLSSCRKNKEKETTLLVEATIKVNQPYEYYLGNFGDEEGATITKQANNYLVSATNRDIATGNIVYKYIPALNFIGTDEVEIRSGNGSIDAGLDLKITYTKIKFKITN